MRGSPFRGRGIVVAALVAALVVPAAVSAAGGDHGRVIPTVAPPSPSSSSVRGGGQSPDIFLVQLADGADTFRKQAKAVGLKYTERYAYKSLFKGVSVRIDPSDVGKLAGIASVARVFPAHYYTLGPEPAADPELATAIKMTGADIAQSEGHTGAGVKVAVMDTGIDVDHPDLGGDGNAAAPHPFPNSRVIGGWDFVGDAYNADPESASYDPVPQPDALPDDCNGHGTHVAGIIGADKASGPNGALGVAPKVSFGAYRVFGCDGSVTDDVMIAAMERIKADGMDVLNMSIGDAFNNWAGTPTAVAADALVDAGIVVVASIGNSGAQGIYSAGAPGVGDKVIGVASYDNSHIQLPAFTATPDNRAFPYLIAAGAPTPPTTGTFPMAKTGTPTTAGDGCVNAPAPGTMTGKVVLIRRGSPPAPAPACTFYLKAKAAQDAGAAGVVLYNNVAGFLNPTVAGSPPITIPVVAITQADGIELNNRIAAGPVSMTWTAGTAPAPNPTAGLISSFSSYGTEAELTLKPDIGAPGGFIRSTYPLEKGGYNTISGTSMASPHVAGAAALLKEAYPSLPASRFRDVLENSADPAVWSLSPGLGLLDNVHRQGAGMVDIDDAINATTLIVPGKLSLGESQAGPATRTLTLSNHANSSVTYDLSHVEAIATGPETFPPLSFWLPDTQVVFDAPSVTVPAHGSATVTVTITADPVEDDLPTGGLYGGYLVFQDHSNPDSVLSVPYAGYKGDYQSIVAIPTAPVIGKLNGPPFIKAQQTYTQATAGHHWTLQSPDEIPNVLIHFDHQVRHLELQVVDAATGQPVHPVFSNIVERDFVGRNGLRPPAGGPYNTDPNNDDVTAFPWDGTRMHDNGVGTPDHRKVVPDGSYKIVVKALKAGGDPKNPAHWETWTTPTIIIDRP